MTILRQANTKEVVQSAEALIEEARRRQRQRRRAVVVVSAILAGALVSVGFVASGGGHARPQATRVGSAPPAQIGLQTKQATAAPGSGTIGAGPTAIDFIDANDGWIASSGDLANSSNPIIVRTQDGGRTWERTPVPDMSNVVIGYQVYRNYGGIVSIHFVDPLHGWYSEAGTLWDTRNGGRTWHLVRFGTVIALTTSGKNVWVFANTCPVTREAFPCGRTYLYHRTIGDPQWHRSGQSLPLSPIGIGELVPDPDGVFVLSDGQTFRVTPGLVVTELQSTCQPIGALTSNTLAGLCNMGGGGNASTTYFATSSDRGAHWSRLLDGPPTDGWVGVAVTNRAGEMFFMTGGATLWRVETTGPAALDWTSVLHTTPGSTDELYPLYFADANIGFVVDSGSTGARVLVTRDGGLTWSPVTLPPGPASRP